LLARQAPTIGGLVAFRSGTGDTTVRVNASSPVTLSNLTVYNASGFVAVSEALGGDISPNHYSYINVTRGPRPPGATTDPLFKTLGGFDSTEMRTGPDEGSAAGTWFDGYARAADTGGGTLEIKTRPAKGFRIHAWSRCLEVWHDPGLPG
jgi:hypothetical protein